MPSRSVFARVLCASLPIACADVMAPGATGRDLDIVVPRADPRLPTARLRTSSETLGNPASVSGGVAGDEVPQELMQLPRIERYYTNAGFTDDAHLAFGSAVMFYFANRAEQSVDVKLRYDGSEVTSSSGFTADSHLLPWQRAMYTQATVGISGACGHMVDAAGVHTAWNEFITSNQGALSWGRESRSSHDGSSQSPCMRTGGSGQGGGWGDQTWYICYYYDWFDYFGNFLYREWVFCVPLNAE